jgi:hypothetical protein
MYGTPTRSMTIASTAMTPTKTKAARQPKYWPSAAAIGTPASVAPVSPSITRPTARARARRRQRGGDQRRDAEVGAVRQAGEEAQQVQREVARRQRRREVAQRVDAPSAR